MLNKKELRKEILKLRDGISEETKKIYDNQIFEKFITHKKFKECKNIFIFVSYKSEVDTHKIIKYCFDNNKKVFIPKVKNANGDMGAFKINSFSQLQIGYKGILECDDTAEEIHKNDIELVVMPGAVFDLNGGRIGYGGGFYDKFLNDLSDNKFKIALAYDFQILNKIPNEVHDVKPNVILTDKRILKIV